jgi:lipopolysaccharide/colanic/teichoic acid biosynthesis glycosyltransferase
MKTPSASSRRCMTSPATFTSRINRRSQAHRPMNHTFYTSVGKRALDVTLALPGLIVLLPLFLIAGAAVRITSRGPAFFRQVRVGQHEKPFRIFKFRTMYQRSESIGREGFLTAAGDPRITPVGRWLRKTKVDELPQLINVLLGEMSLVGPRPEVSAYTDTYNERQRAILAAKPGVTGPSANVHEEELIASHPDKDNFYLTTVMPAKLEIDIAYCESIHFAGDVRQIVRTVATVLFKIMEAYKPRFRTSPKQI